MGSIHNYLYKLKITDWTYDRARLEAAIVTAFGLHKEQAEIWVDEFYRWYYSPFHMFIKSV